MLIGLRASRVVRMRSKPLLQQPDGGGRVADIPLIQVGLPIAGQLQRCPSLSVAGDEDGAARVFNQPTYCLGLAPGGRHVQRRVAVPLIGQRHIGPVLQQARDLGPVPEEHGQVQGALPVGIANVDVGTVLEEYGHNTAASQAGRRVQVSIVVDVAAAVKNVDDTAIGCRLTEETVYDIQVFLLVGNVSKCRVTLLGRIFGRRFSSLSGLSLTIHLDPIDGISVIATLHIVDIC